MKQSAVEWLQEQLKDVKYNPLETNGYSNALERLYDQAKEMEKKQIIDACNFGYYEGCAYMSDIKSKYESFEQYYDEKFNKEI